MLSILIWLPILGALLIAIWPKLAAQRVRQVALVVTGLTLLWTIWLVSQFDISTTSWQMEEFLPWAEKIGLAYHLALDGLSLPLLVVNSLLVWVAMYASAKAIHRPRLYFALLLLLEASVAGAFLAKNLLLFFLFYELELIPLYLLIAIWGGQRRGYAATKFLIYTAISGVLILGAFFGLAWLGNVANFDYDVLRSQALPVTQQLILLTVLAVGFGIKIPVVPFHTWLPDAHGEASTPISVLLAGVLLKLGTYGLLRFGLGLFPDAWKQLAPWLAVFAIINVIYGSFIAIAQTDMKRMVAYSSIGHMGYIILAAAAATPLSVLGATCQMVSHGLISGLLFLLVGVVYAKTGTRDINILQGLFNPERGMPVVGSLMVAGCMASAGIPGMVGFIAEFMVFRGSFSVFPIPTLLCMVGTGLTAIYFLTLLNRVFYGRLTEALANLPRVYWQDRIPAIVITALIVVLGLQPMWLARWSETTAAGLGFSVAEMRAAAAPQYVAVMEALQSPWQKAESIQIPAAESPPQLPLSSS
jgi:NAD(P)H-quinone oxidoreductase subunit 4